MNNDLHRIVYLSRNDIPGDEATMRSEISQILRSAREKNNKNGITGALMFNKSCFAQVLEGPQDAVMETFSLIEVDERHSDVVILDSNPVDSRGFPEWSMAYVGEESSLEDRFFMIAEETNFDPSCLSGDEVFEALSAALKKSDDPSTLKNAA
ncbi:MAG: BLUF domain-containing protein [Granulosicoccus sp.]